LIVAYGGDLHSKGDHAMTKVLTNTGGGIQMTKESEKYFIVEHEGHVSPHNEAEELKHFPDFKRFQHCIPAVMRTVYGAAGAPSHVREAHIKAASRGLPQPESTIAQMDDAGVDMLCLVPHRHTLHMEVDPKGTNMSFMIDACERYPDRLIMGPVFEPSTRGIKTVLREMEFLVKEKGVKYCKVYLPGEAWAPNDERMWPFWAKAQELGLVVAMHTGHGYVYGANTHAAMPGHLERVCQEFYDLRLLAFHFGWPWHHELNLLAGAYPNLYIGMSFLNITAVYRPRFFAELIGEAMLIAGEDKLIWSNDGCALPDVVEGFAKFEMPEDMQKGYGYPALTKESKAKMFGLNMARLLGIEATKRVGKTALSAKA
jgi:predicted TIM-barrel fold metal-dependent hydrolase